MNEMDVGSDPRTTFADRERVGFAHRIKKSEWLISNTNDANLRDVNR